MKSKKVSAEQASVEVPPDQGKSFKKKLLAAGALLCAGGALIAGTGGVTGALWSGQVVQPGERIQSGKLALDPGTQQAYDTSPDVTAHPIDLATNKIVPGDVTSIAQPEAITLIGANLKADLSVQVPQGGALSGALAAPGSGVTGVAYLVAAPYDPATFTPSQALASAPLDGTSAGGVVHFNQPTLNNNNTVLNNGSLTDGTPKLYTVTVITYAASATDAMVMSASADVANITTTLTQVR